MDAKQTKVLIDLLTDIRNLLILNASRSGANSVEISKVINTSDARVRQILTGAAGKRKKGDGSVAVDKIQSGGMNSA